MTSLSLECLFLKVTKNFTDIISLFCAKATELLAKKLHFSTLSIYANYAKFKDIMMQRTANENAAYVGSVKDLISQK